MESYLQIDRKTQEVMDQYKQLIETPLIKETPHYKETLRVKSI